MAVATTLCVVLLLVDAAQCFSLNTRSFMTMSMSTSGKPKGCAAKPFERKNVRSTVYFQDIIVCLASSVHFSFGRQECGGDSR
jgi:hypothetical protein